MRLPLCCRIDFDDECSAKALEADGWRRIETLQTWAGVVSRRKDPRVKMRTPFYWKSCHTRLHKDPMVLDDVADEARRQMIQQAVSQGECMGIGDDAFVVFHREGHTRIDFIEVHERSRGKGLGKALIHHIGGEIVAGTQSLNEPAKAFYRSLGFRVAKMQRTYHK